MKVTLTVPEPVPPPEGVVTLELSEGDAKRLQTILGFLTPQDFQNKAAQYGVTTRLMRAHFGEENTAREAMQFGTKLYRDLEKGGVNHFLDASGKDVSKP